MTNGKQLGLTGISLLCLLVGSAAGGAAAETAALPPGPANAKDDHVVYSLQFSADSSRLLVVGGIGKPPLSPNKALIPAAIWDVGKKQLASAWPNANLPIGAQEVPGKQVIGGWSVTGPVINDSATGAVIKPEPLDGLLKVYCTAQAVSADGTLLAVAWDQAVGKSSGTRMQFRVGSIGVWDLAARKWKWRLNGSELEGENNVTRSTVFHDQRAADRAHVGNLAFSPDGQKLAAVVGTELHVLALENGKETPAVVLKTELHRQYLPKGMGAEFAWIEDGTRTPHQFQWLANGTLLKQKDSLFVTLDASTGKLKEWFDVMVEPAKPDPPEAVPPAPKRPPPPKRPAPKPGPPRPASPKPAAPKPAPQTQPAPAAEEDSQPAKACMSTSLSAEAKLLAILYSEKSDEMAVEIWDVAGRRRRGVLKLPVDPFGKTGIPTGAVMVGPNVFVTPNRKPGDPVDTRRGIFPIALSPDGKQLAVPDRYGVVHVYDVGQIEANTGAVK